MGLDKFQNVQTGMSSERKEMLCKSVTVDETMHKRRLD